LTELLKEIQDASRIVQKFLLGRGETDDLANIKDTIKIWNQIKARILQEEKIRLRETGPTDVGTESWRNCSTLIGKMADLQELADRISMAVDESALRKPQKSNAGVDGADEEEEADEEADLPGPTSFRAWTIKPG
jgi:DNA mismatch repair ATPase MutS